ncbi:YegJ family protein [Noviherbaspirillum aerium]|uniref:YegJ family protein n=1 Tax=Noviherbaspirillum aerium TaxID=2588497 RepID=UPI00124F0FCA|nr:DUF2314 domain-containing protein [Noviherbaspirillum aerium]
MRHLAFISLFLLTTLPAQAQSVIEKAKKDELLFMQDEEPEMRKAFLKASRSLDDFLLRAKTPARGTSYYALKVEIREGKNTEYFWIGPFEQRGDEFSGTLDNAPRIVKGVREGQIYPFRKSQIVDWTYYNKSEHRMYGNFTLCALLTKEPPEEAKSAQKNFGLKCE